MRICKLLILYINWNGGNSSNGRYCKDEIIIWLPKVAVEILLSTLPSINTSNTSGKAAISVWL